MKKNYKLILGIFIGIIISGVVYAATYNAREISFTPTDTNWNVDNIEDAVNSLYKGKKSVFIDSNNRDSGVKEFKIEYDNDEVYIFTGQEQLEYKVNDGEYNLLETVGYYQDGWGFYVKKLSLKKDDTLYIKRGTAIKFGYAVVI